MPTADLRPFPRLSWDGYDWSTQVTLPWWSGFQERGGAYGGLSSLRPSRGVVTATVSTEGDEPSEPPAAAGQAYQFLLEHGRVIGEAMLTAIFDIYRRDYWENLKMALSCAGWDDVINEVPYLASKEQLAEVLGLSSVQFVNVEKDGVGYVGFEFGCSWDGEHGLGIMTHKDRIVEVGQAPVSFDYWVAKGDLDGVAKAADDDDDLDDDFDDDDDDRPHGLDAAVSSIGEFWQRDPLALSAPGLPAQKTRFRTERGTMVVRGSDEPPDSLPNAIPPEQWDASWILIGVQNKNPIFIAPELRGYVFSAKRRRNGFWLLFPIARSPAAFIVMASASDHAHRQFKGDERTYWLDGIVEDWAEPFGEFWY